MHLWVGSITLFVLGMGNCSKFTWFAGRAKETP